MRPAAWLAASSALVAALAMTPSRAPAVGVADDRADPLVAHVLNRLAFGPKPGDVDRVRRIGVDAYIDEQLHPERIALPADLSARLASLDVQRLPAGTLVDGYRAAQQANREAQRNQALTAEGKRIESAPLDAAVDARRDQYRRLNLQTTEARLVQAIDSPRQLQEVMTEFWFNHFNVFIGKDLDRALVSNYERDAIRPNALGHFRDLLGATAKHPAMLFYLDNWLSTGVDALVNRNAKQALGLNENYAREVMELHTLGVENEGKPGGYTQQDVTELARMLTGWTFDARATGRGGPLAGVESQDLFIFAPRRHDNGTKTWLGRTIPASGVQEGEYALDVLATHPATARHISDELAQYFVADTPPPALVARLAARFLATDGDIREVLRTLFASPEFRDPATMNAKFKTPYQYVVSAARASGIAIVNTQPLAGALAQLGMPLYGCQTPDGYKNTQDAWLNPDGMTRRINFATALANGRLGVDREPPPPMVAANAIPSANPSSALPVVTVAASAAVQPVALLDTLGPTISDRTRGVVLGSEPRLAAALVLGSPDFMHR